jgi:hypothetical protein
MSGEMLFNSSLRAKRGNPALYLKGNSGLPPATLCSRLKAKSLAMTAFAMTACIGLYKQ